MLNIDTREFAASSVPGLFLLFSEERPERDACHLDNLNPLPLASQYIGRISIGHNMLPRSYQVLRRVNWRCLQPAAWLAIGSNSASIAP